MRERLAEMFRIAREEGALRKVADGHDDADESLALFKDAIEKGLAGKEEGINPVAEAEYHEGWYDCKHWILSMLEGPESK